MKYSHRDIDTEVIDNKLSLSKWDGEATFSINYAGKINHYPIRRPSPTDKLRWLNLGGIDPVEVPIEYELTNHIRPADIQISTYWSNKPALMYFGNAKFPVENIDIPEVRAVSRSANPFYMDKGLVMIDMHYNGHDANLSAHLEIAIKQVLKEEYGIDVYAKGTKLYYKDPNGHDVKISSPETAEGHTWTYLNIDSEYNTYLKYSTTEKPRDNYAYGLKRNYPAVDTQVVDKIVNRLAELSNLSLVSDTYSAAELKEIARLKPIHADTNWVTSGQRNDPGYHYFNDEGHEYEVVLNKKPESNVIAFNVKSNNLVFYYQQADDRQNTHTPVQVDGSFAAYHADESLHHTSEKYKAGKAFHIYAPVAIDSNANKVKCSYDPTWDGTKDLAINIPQDFLDSAAYPVIIDPTFGYTTAGGTQFGTSTSGPQYAALVSQTGFAAIVKSLWFYGCQSGGANLNFVLGLYNHGTGARVDYTAQTNASGSSAVAAWNGYNTQVGATLTAIAYDIGLQCPTGSSYQFININFDTATNAGGVNTAVAYSSPPPSTEPTLTLNNDKYSFYGSTFAADPRSVGLLNLLG